MQKKSEVITSGGAGAVIGGIAGLAVGLGAIAIPGIGAAIAAGPLAVAIGGAGIGAAAGGIIGALTAKTIDGLPLDKQPETPRNGTADEPKPTPPSGLRVYLDGLEMVPHQSRFEDFEPHYRADFTTRNLVGATYDQLSPAYRLAYNLATDPRLANQGWPEIEPYAQAQWEKDHPGTWNTVKEVVHSTWLAHRSGRITG